MTYCGERTIVKHNVDRREATTLRCRSWTCSDCVDGRRRQLIAQAHRGKANTFITLTVRRSQYADPTMAAKALAQAWRIIVKRALREATRDPSKHPRPFGAAPAGGWGKSSSTRIPRQVRLEEGGLQYLAVFEAHVSGWPHLHILTRSAWIDIVWLKAQTQDLMNSPVAFIQRVHRKSQVNAYVAKYCGKDVHKFGTAKRYWQSGSYQLTKYEKPSSKLFAWGSLSQEAKHISYYRHIWELDAWIVKQPNAWHVEAEPPDKYPVWWGDPPRGLSQKGGAPAPVL